MWWGKAGETPLCGFRVLGPSPSPALTSCVALGGSLNLPGSLFYPLLMRGQNNSSNSGREKDSHAIPCSLSSK